MNVPHGNFSCTRHYTCSSGPENLAFLCYWSYCYSTRKLDETCWICRHWITRKPRGRTTKARQTYRQLPIENVENTDCHTAVQLCKRSKYFLDGSMSGTELNYLSSRKRFRVWRTWKSVKSLIRFPGVYWKCLWYLLCPRHNTEILYLRMILFFIPFYCYAIRLQT